MMMKTKHIIGIPKKTRRFNCMIGDMPKATFPITDKMVIIIMKVTGPITTPAM
jgi:hypothetical protein